MRNNVLILFLLILIQSCESDQIIDNTRILSSIDSLKFNTTIYKVILNEKGDILDTVSIKKLKRNKEGKTLYSIENQNLKFGTKSIEEYYRSNEDLAFQKIKYSDSWTTEYETFVNQKNEVMNARMITIENGEIDTISLNFKHNYSLLGKLKTLSINGKIDSTKSLNFTRYNSDEKVDSELMIIGNDTVEKINFIYRGGKIMSSTREFRSGRMVSISQYGKNESVKTKTEYIKKEDSLIKTTVTRFKYNSKDELVTEEIKDLENDTIMRYKYLTAHNNV